MDGLTAINRVSSIMGISSRTLRYWEESGLFNSVRDAGSGWRLYDDNALQCIRVTDLLRRLDFTVREIREVMEKRTVASLNDVLRRQLGKLGKARWDIDARAEAITTLIEMLEHQRHIQIPDGVRIALPSLETILQPLALERKKHILSKIQGGMEMARNKFDEVQYITMPPARAVAFNVIGKEPEDEAYQAVKAWIDENKLTGTARIFAFNVEPYPTEQSPEYGMGFCATIPEGITIPTPLYEMRLPGGTYAVISEYEGDPSWGWKKIQALIDDPVWEWEFDASRHPGLEEHIGKAGGGFIIPILFPVKKKQ